MNTRFLFWFLVGIIGILLAIFLAWSRNGVDTLLDTAQPIESPEPLQETPEELPVEHPSQIQAVSGPEVPLDRAKERVTKKPFGIYITPSNSPVSPERFQGYHTGTDYEIFPEEADIAVEVRAVCSGTITVKQRASGYGGVVVERCEIGGEPVTVVYGHLALSGVEAGVNDAIEKGTILGVLGAARSTDTDGERKHLHLSIHKGTITNIRGYVANKNMLTDWIDPCIYFCRP